MYIHICIHICIYIYVGERYVMDVYTTSTDSTCGCNSSTCGYARCCRVAMCVAARAMGLFDSGVSNCSNLVAARTRCCSVLQCVAVRCNALHCVTGCCAVSKCSNLVASNKWSIYTSRNSFIRDTTHSYMT